MNERHCSPLEDKKLHRRRIEARQIATNVATLPEHLFSSCMAMRCMKKRLTGFMLLVNGFRPIAGHLVFMFPIILTSCANVFVAQLAKQRVASASTEFAHVNPPELRIRTSSPMLCLPMPHLSK